MSTESAEPATTAADPADPTLEADVFSRNCGSRDVLQTVTSRWGVLALAALAEGELRFSALRRRIDGVSERMLSQTLQSLERDGLVSRTVLQAIPPKVEYALTPLGSTVATHLISLIDVVEGSLPAVDRAREEYDRRRSEPQAPGAPAGMGPQSPRSNQN